MNRPTEEATAVRRREVTWEDPLLGAALALDLSGLDYLRAIAEERIPRPPIAALLGMGIADIRPGGNGDGTKGDHGR